MREAKEDILIIIGMTLVSLFVFGSNIWQLSWIEQTQYEYMVGKDNINLLSPEQTGQKTRPEHLVKGLRIYLFLEL